MLDCSIGGGENQKMCVIEGFIDTAKYDLLSKKQNKKKTVYLFLEEQNGCNI